MKKHLLSLSLLALAATAGAETLDYLTFVRTDGTEFSLPAQGLTLTFGSGNLVAFGSGTATLPLAELSKMMFTATASGITVLRPDEGRPVAVYTTGGVLVGSYADTAPLADILPNGVYVVRHADGQTSKIAIR